MPSFLKRFRCRRGRDKTGSTCGICGLHEQDSSPVRNKALKQISPPVLPPDEVGYSCFIEGPGNLWRVTWTGSLVMPLLESESFLESSIIKIERIKLSPPLALIWAQSKHLCFGSEGMIRCTHEKELPIIKIASPETDGAARLQREHSILKEMMLLPIPTPKVSEEMVMDDEGKAVGYRMESLRWVDWPELKSRLKEIHSLVHDLHAHGFVHGDLTGSNIMADSANRLVLIDFSCAGRIGDPIPNCIPEWAIWAYDSERFHQRVDEAYLVKLEQFLEPY